MEVTLKYLLVTCHEFHWITILPPECPLNMLPIEITHHHICMEEFVWWGQTKDGKIPMMRNMVLGVNLKHGPQP